MPTMEDLRYPIGRFRFDPPATDASRADAIASIAAAPAVLRAAVTGLDEGQLATHYRPGGWTVRQVVHHFADSHVNAYMRFRLTLTEEEPTIRTYEEAAWAELPDAREAPLELSLALLDRLHERWVLLLRALPPAAMERTLRHPDRGVMTLDHLLQLYAWHGKHHAAHVTSLRTRKNW
jgi:uncharacterized damage-inducible protein DinB